MSQKTLEEFSVDGKPWRDAELLWELYKERKLSMHEIANRLGCSRSSVRRGLQHHDIETRSVGEASRLANKNSVPRFRTETDGYEFIRESYKNETNRVYVHRLVAIAEYGFEAVCNSVVHHENEVRWDNRPSNISLMGSHSEHAREHHAIEHRRYLEDRDLLKSLYHEYGMLTSEIAELAGCSPEPIREAMARFDIERRTRGAMSKELRKKRQEKLTEDGVPKDIELD